MNHHLVHADWSTRPHARWMCRAEIRGGRVAAAAPEPVGELSTFWPRLLAEAGRGAAVTVGFDFPIGVPEAWARVAGVGDFPSLLPRLGRGEWGRFYAPAEAAHEIGPRRPFYPMRPGGTARQHLLDGLGVAEGSALLRRCERPTAHRGAASPLFWTLGGQQVGKAAIVGWRDVIAPALESPMETRLWPFHGALHDLIAPDVVTVAETYPADACVQLGLDAPGRGWSKRRQDDRRRIGAGLAAWARRREVTLAPSLSHALADGFGPRASGEDAFDAVVGLFGMLEVVLGHRSDGAPDDVAVRSVEGWILGLGEG